MDCDAVPLPSKRSKTTYSAVSVKRRASKIHKVVLLQGTMVNEPTAECVVSESPAPEPVVSVVKPSRLCSHVSVSFVSSTVEYR